MYDFVKKSASNTLVQHADHLWEEWKAFYSAEWPDFPIDGNATGICCHTCHLVIVEV